MDHILYSKSGKEVRQWDGVKKETKSVGHFGEDALVQNNNTHLMALCLRLPR